MSGRIASGKRLPGSIPASGVLEAEAEEVPLKKLIIAVGLNESVTREQNATVADVHARFARLPEAGRK